jgi:predicted methyltransferase
MKMAYLCKSNNKWSPKLKASVIEPILLICINGVYIYKILFEIQRILPVPYKILKKYLFYLVRYELVSYNGQRQIYVTEVGGLDLLYKIHKKRQSTCASCEDFTITIE